MGGGDSGGGGGGDSGGGDSGGGSNSGRGGRPGEVLGDRYRSFAAGRARLVPWLY